MNTVKQDSPALKMTFRIVIGFREMTLQHLCRVYFHWSIGDYTQKEKKIPDILHVL